MVKLAGHCLHVLGLWCSLLAHNSFGFLKHTLQCFILRWTVLLCSNRSDVYTPPTYLSYAATAVAVGTGITEASHHLLSSGGALCPKCTQDRRLYRWRLPWCPSTSQTRGHYLISTTSSLLVTFCVGHFSCEENCHSKGCNLSPGRP